VPAAAVDVSVPAAPMNGSVPAQGGSLGLASGASPTGFGTTIFDV